MYSYLWDTTLEGYRQALRECEELLRDEGRGWEILDPLGRSYMRVISDRRKLLLGEERWSQLDADSRRQLKGSYRRKDREWWGLTRISHTVTAEGFGGSVGAEFLPREQVEQKQAALRPCFRGARVAGTAA